MTRDPRQDPQPGDVVRLTRGDEWSVWVVIGAKSERVTYTRTATEHDMATGRADLASWRRCCAAATVLHPLGVTYDGSPALADPDDLSDGRWSGR